ncbi:MAG TPA: hypothetical protein PLU81_12155 [Deltaproteobacteria bacterium]|nr:hypothetical protein [Deltaproteobacteria bacterium]
MNRFTPLLDQPFWEEHRRKTACSLGGKSLSGSLYKVLDQDLDTLHTLVHPQMLYAEYSINALDEYIHTQAGSIESRMFSRLARGCSPDCSVIFMVATLGSGFDTYSSLIKDLSRQFMVDTAGSVCVEMAADLLQDHLLEQAEQQGKDVGMRFSPGYCDWDLSGQRLIFDALDAGTIGVSLNDYDVMAPSKTISAAVLMATDVPVKVPCRFCERDDCPWRRLPYGKAGSE